MSNYCPYCYKNLVGQSLCDLSRPYGKYDTNLCRNVPFWLCHKWLERAIREKREGYEFINVDGIVGREKK